MSEQSPASGLGAYADLRPLTFSIAYRMLGSVSDAEEVVQEVYLRVHTAASRRASGSSRRGPTRRR